MSNEPYVVQHTAEEIDRKLSLIDENKNLLKYPYLTTLSNPLSDVGDGSILILNSPNTDLDDILLTTIQIPTGEQYTISIAITDILEKNVIDSECSLKVVIDGKTTETRSAHVLDLTNSAEAEVSAAIYLKIPKDCEASY